MALADVTPIDPFKNHPHGTQAEDALAPSGTGNLFVGYPDRITVVGADAVVVSATSDIEIVDGAPAVKTGAKWTELGTIGAPGYLRLNRVRYAFVKGSATIKVFTGEYNPIEATAAVEGLDK